MKIFQLKYLRISKNTFLKNFVLIAILVLFCSIGHSEDYYELEENWNSVSGVPKVLSVRSKLNRESNQKVYWGLAATLGKDWPSSDDKRNKEYIDWLCRLGFNFQRINGLDFKRIKLFNTWQKTPGLLPQGIEPILGFINELKKNSVDYSLSINTSSDKLSGFDVVKNAHQVAHKRYKYSQIIEPIAIQASYDWHRAVYAQYLEVGKSLAEDEDNIYITAIGEDSLVGGYFANKGRFIGRELNQKLNPLFTSYLNNKYENTSDFYNSWRIDSIFKKRSIGSLEDGVHLPSLKEFENLPTSAKRDVLTFLVEKDTEYADGLHRVLDQLGYNGLYTFTNDWYGPAVLNTNAITGSFIDIHAYFDHSVLNRKSKPPTETIRNQSFIQNVKVRKDGYIEPYGKNIYHLFASSVKNLPLIVSEWNQAAWSEYAYEGPLLITAYASLQGYKGLMMHTLRRWDMTIDQSFSSDSFSMIGNPVMLALSPILSYVYRNQIIRQAKTSIDIVLSESKKELMDLAGNVGLNMGSFYKYASLNTGFIHKINIVPVGRKSKGEPLSLSGCCNFESDTGEIKLYLEDNSPRLEINTPQFRAVAGATPPEGISLSGQNIKIEGHGAVTILSLDNQPIENSKDILIAAVRDFKNSNMKVKTIKRGPVGKALSVENSGGEPVLMGRVRGFVELKLDHEDEMSVDAVSFSGKLKPVSFDKKENSVNSQYYILKLDREDAPWYRIKSKNKSF